jgi:hypothetical protein
MEMHPEQSLWNQFLVAKISIRGEDVNGLGVASRKIPFFHYDFSKKVF